MEKYGGIVLQDLGAATELDSSVPGEQKEAAGWFPGGFEDCCKDDLLASRVHQKRNAKYFRSMTSVAVDEGDQIPGKCSRMLVLPSFT